jgi:hypothetical protein
LCFINKAGKFTILEVNFCLHIQGLRSMDTVPNLMQNRWQMMDDGSFLPVMVELKMLISYERLTTWADLHELKRSIEGSDWFDIHGKHC